MTSNVVILAQNNKDCQNIVSEFLNYDQIIEGFIKFIPFPSYHLEPNLPFRSISLVISKILQKINETQLTKSNYFILNSVCKFLARTLFGEVQRHITSTYKPNIIISLQDCFINTILEIDDITTSIHNVGGMTKLAEDLRNLENILTIEEKKILRFWLQVVNKRINISLPILKFENLIYLIMEVGRYDFLTQYKILKSLFLSRPCNKIFLFKQFLCTEKQPYQDGDPYIRSVKIKNIIAKIKDIETDLELTMISNERNPLSSMKVVSAILTPHARSSFDQSMLIKSQIQKYII